MKNKKNLQWFAGGLAITLISLSLDSNAQIIRKRLPDGTIIYSDGSVKKPNGEIKYPDGTVKYPNGSYPGSTTKRYPGNGTQQADGSIIYPDGRVRYPDGTVRYPDGRVKQPDGSVRYPDGTVKYPNDRNNRNEQWIPPGQAKKLYKVGQRYNRSFGNPWTYNQIPDQLRSQYQFDQSDRYYYNNGYLSQVDPKSMLIQQVISTLLR